MKNSRFKFRAWNSLTNSMMYNLKEMGKFALRDYLSNDDFLVLPDTECYPLMQWTGLADKNGVDIYECDVVRLKSGDTAKIVFLCGSFMCEWLEDDCYSEEMSVLLWKARGGDDDMFEVVGNIYENKELLYGDCTKHTTTLKPIQTKRIKTMDGLEKLITALETAMQETVYLQDMKCVNCKYYGLGNCILIREVELQSGLYGDGLVEIDNPNEHYCADFDKI